MKKYLFLLLLAVSISYGQTTVANKLKITGNTKQNGNTRVMVGDSLTKEVNFIMKSSLLNRANHTGEQPISTVTNLQDSLTSTANRVEVLENLQNLQTNFTAQAYAIWSGVGFIYDVIYPSYYIQGILYPSGTAQITLNSSDVTDPRLDVIAVDATGVIKLTGIAAENPVIPTVDSQTQIAITTILVPAQATVPVQATTDINIYKENLEWVGSSSFAGINYASTAFPFQGTKSVSIPAFTPLTILFTAPATIQATDFDLVTFAVRLNGVFSQNNNKITISFFNGTTRVSSTLIINDGQFNFKRTIVGAYQLITIPIGSFTFTNSSITKLEFGLLGSHSTGLYIDNIILTKGASSTPPTQKAIVSIVTPNGVLNATTADDVIAMSGSNGTIISAVNKTITISPPTLVAGTNITINNTNPTAPVINATSPLPSTTITDGVTTTSPNEDVVFDALALKVDKNASITGATNTKITYDTKGLVTSGTSLIASDIPTIAQSQVTNLTSDLAGKAPLSSLTNTQNFLVKYGLTGQTISRLQDTGSYLGIGTTNTPTKDITLGNQENKVLGIEQSSNTVVGRSLSIEAGRTINFINSSDFVSINQAFGFTAMNSTSNGDIWGYSGDIYKQTGGAGNFISQGTNSLGLSSVCSAPNGDIYGSVYGGNIYKQTGGIGSFVSLAQTVRNWSAVTVASNGDVYAAVDGGDIYKQTGGTGDFIALSQISRQWKSLDAAPNGDIYAAARDSQIYKQSLGSGNFDAVVGSPSGAWRALVVTSTSDVYAALYDGYGYIYKQTGGTGPFVQVPNSYNAWYSMTVAPSGNIYASGIIGGVFVQQNNGPGSADLNGGTLKLASGTGKGTGSSSIELYTGAKTVSGTDMQSETLRVKIDNEGLMTLPSVTNALIEADVTGKAVVTKEYVSNRISEYKTYFINSATGSNITGVYEDATKPFATIDYVLALPALKDNDVIYLQGSNTGAAAFVYPLNSLIPDVNLTIMSEGFVTLSFSNNTNAYSHVSSALLTKYKFLNIYLPNGEILNDRAGGAGVFFYYVSGEISLDIKVNKITVNTSNPMFGMSDKCSLEANIVKVRTRLLTILTSTGMGKINIESFECLAINATICYEPTLNITLRNIYGTGSYIFIGGKYNIGNISTTGTCTTGNNGTVTHLNFMDSTITSTGGFDLGNYYGAGLLVTGVIKSTPIFIFSGNEYGYNPIRIVNFSADIGAGYFNVYGANVTIENSSIKSTNSPLMFWNGYGANPSFIIKNSTFEVVNSVPLVGGFLAGASASVKIAGVSTNATTITTVPNVTVIQFNNY